MVGSAADHRRKTRFDRAWIAHLAGTGLESVDDGRRGVERGRCAGCLRPDHVAYGPFCRSLLCDGCTAVLAAWRALDDDARRRTRLVYPRWKGR
jgi:hypothetical protein